MHRSTIKAGNGGLSLLRRQEGATPPRGLGRARDMGFREDDSRFSVPAAIGFRLPAVRCLDRGKPRTPRKAGRRASRTETVVVLLITYFINSMMGLPSPDRGGYAESAGAS